MPRGLCISRVVSTTLVAISSVVIVGELTAIVVTLQVPLNYW
jgi:hypothetical protein